MRPVKDARIVNYPGEIDGYLHVEVDFPKPKIPNMGWNTYYHVSLMVEMEFDKIPNRVPVESRQEKGIYFTGHRLNEDTKDFKKGDLLNIGGEVTIHYSDGKISGLYAYYDIETKELRLS